jgi:hypothetical protein
MNRWQILRVCLQPEILCIAGKKRGHRRKVSVMSLSFRMAVRESTTGRRDVNRANVKFRSLEYIDGRIWNGEREGGEMQGRRTSNDGMRRPA